MSDEEGTAPGEETSSSGLDAITGRLSLPGELLLALGAALVVFVDLLGNVILEEYSFGRVPWVASLLILITVAAHRWGERSLFAAYGRALVVLGLVAGATVARELVADVSNDYLDGGATTLMALIFYVGGALLLIGSWQSWSSDEGNA